MVITIITNTPYLFIVHDCISCIRIHNFNLSGNPQVAKRGRGLWATGKLLAYSPNRIYKARDIHGGPGHTLSTSQLKAYTDMINYEYLTEKTSVYNSEFTHTITKHTLGVFNMLANHDHDP